MNENKIIEKLNKFKEKASIIHKNKYNYDKFIFINKTTKGIITCPIHGDFLQTPKNHLKGQGCPECGKDYAKKYRKNNYNIFLKTANKRFDNCFEYPYIEEEYENSHSKITIKCKKCGNTFTKIACDHITSEKGGCKTCNNESNKKYYTYKDLQKYNINNINIIFFEGKKEQNDKITINCKEHGKYEILIKTLIKGKGECKICALLKCNENKIAPYRIFKEKMLNNYPTIKLYDETYINMNTKMKFQCSICNHIFERKPNTYDCSILTTPCPKCTQKYISEKNTKTTEEFKNRINEIFGTDIFDTTNSVYTKSDELITVKCKQCGEYITRKANYFLQGHGCPYHFRNNSKSEIEISDYIKSLNVKVENNNRNILDGNHELDIYIPNERFAIEFDGLYWHNELNKPKNYHVNKTNECIKKGIRLFHIFEDEWIEKQNIIKSMLNNLLNKNITKIYARKCEIKEVTYNDSVNFLNENHLQGNCVSKIRYGLYYNDELVSLMTFGKTRFTKDKDGYELLRFCNKLNTTVIGGASKLINHFIKSYTPKNIISYADRRWSNGNLYEKLGFKQYRVSPPSYYYVINNKRYNRILFQKNKLIEKYNCPINKTEHEFCLEHKWFRIYDCGNLCFKLSFNN